MTVLIDVKDRMVSLALGTFGVDLFIGKLPDAPDSAAALMEYAGSFGQFSHDSAVAEFERPRFQINVRDAVYATGRATIESIYKGVPASNIMLNGTQYLRIVALQPPFFLKRDENDRPIFICNFEAMKAVS